jgi:hypothetical protein
MDADISKTYIEVAGKVAESLAPGAVKKVLSWMSGGKTPKATQTGDRQGPDARRDRRVSGVQSRLRKGLWMEYHRKSGLGVDSVLHNITSQTRDHLFHALVTESQRYKFSDRNLGAALEPSTIAGPAVDVVLAKWKLQPKEERQAVLIVEEIADYLLANYNVSRIDRRIQNRASASA